MKSLYIKIMISLLALGGIQSTLHAEINATDNLVTVSNVTKTKFAGDVLIEAMKGDLKGDIATGLIDIVELTYSSSAKNKPELLSDIFNSHVALKSLDELQLSKVSKYQESLTTLNKYGGALLDIAGAGLSVYSFTQNSAKLFNSDGNVYENVANITSDTLSIAQASTKIYSLLPNNLMAKKWAESSFASALGSKAVSRTSGVLLFLQVEAEIFSYFREKTLDLTKANVLSFHSSKLKTRVSMIEQLYAKHINAIENGFVIGRGEISDILYTYGVSSPHSSTGGLLQPDTILYEIFNGLSNNQIFLFNEFSKYSFNELNSYERVIVALKALTDISVKENDDHIKYLDEVVTGGFGWNDVLVGAFQGSDGYQIFDTFDLKKQMDMTYGSGYNAVAIMQKQYEIIYNSMLADYEFELLKNIGEIQTRLKAESDSETYEDSLSISIYIPEISTFNTSTRMIHTNLGSNLQVRFSQAYLDKYPDIFDYSYEQFKIWYETSSGVRNVTSATYDSTTNGLSFIANSSEDFKLLKFESPKISYGVLKYETVYFPLNQLAINLQDVKNIITNVDFVSENPVDDVVESSQFTKTWSFSEDIVSLGLSISVISNTYANTVSGSSFIINGKNVSVSLTPNPGQETNKLVVQFKNTNNEVVTVSGYSTFWSQTISIAPEQMVIACDENIITNENIVSTVAYSAKNTSGQSIPVDISTYLNPEHGVVSVNNDIIYYMPNNDYYGIDKFQLAFTSNGETEIKSVNVTINKYTAPIEDVTADSSITVAARYFADDDRFEVLWNVKSIDDMEIYYSYDSYLWVSFSQLSLTGYNGNSYSKVVANSALHNEVFFKAVSSTNVTSNIFKLEYTSNYITPDQTFVEPPAIPVITTNQNITSNNYLQLTWKRVNDSNNRDNVKYYEVEYADNIGFTNTKLVNAGNNAKGENIYESCSYTVSGLLDNKTYYFRVRSYNDYNGGSISNWSVSKAVNISIDNIPYFLTDSSYEVPKNNEMGVSRTAEMRWKAQDDDGDLIEYKVTYSRSADYFSGGSGSAAGSSDWIIGNQFHSIDSVLDANTKYYWQVEAREDGAIIEKYAGEWIKSPVWSFTTESNGADLAITNVELLTQLDFGELATFKLLIKNVGNQVAIDENITSNYIKNGNSSKFRKGSSYIGKDLLPGESIEVNVDVKFRDSIYVTTSFTYDNVLIEDVSFVEFVITYDSSDDANESNNSYIKEINYKVGEKPTVPLINNLPSSTSNSYIDLLWKKVIDSSGNDNVNYYEVMYADNTSFENSRILGAGKTLVLDSTNTYTYTIGSLTNNKSYSFKVRAINDLGASEWSEYRSVNVEISTPPYFDNTVVYPVNSSTGISKTLQFKWKAVDDDGDSLEYYVQWGEASDKLYYNSGWIENGNQYFDINTKLKPNTVYYWKVQVRESGLYSDSYGGGYIETPIRSFTTVSIGADLSIINVEMIGVLKPDSDVKFRLTVKNTGTVKALGQYIRAYYKKGDKTTLFNNGSYNMPAELEPDESIIFDIDVRFMDHIMEANEYNGYKERDNVLVLGDSYVIFNIPVEDDDVNPANNTFEYMVTYENLGAPVITQFDLYGEENYNGISTRTWPLYFFIGNNDRNRFSFEAVDDFEITKATIEYKLDESSPWQILKSYTTKGFIYDPVTGDSSTFNVDNISANLTWNVPTSENFITGSMQFRVRVYESDAVYSEKVSAPISIFGLETVTFTSFDLDKTKVNQGDNITFSWGSDGTSGTLYTVYVKEASSVVGWRQLFSAKGVNSKTVPFDYPEGEYSVEVKSGLNAIVYSGTITVETVLDSLTSPTINTINYSMVNDDGIIELSWSAVADAVDYIVERRENGLFIEMAVTSETSFVDNNVFYGKEYTYVVTAKNESITSVPGKAKIIKAIYNDNYVINITTSNDQLLSSNSLVLEYQPDKSVSYEAYEILLGVSSDDMKLFARTQNRSLVLEELNYATTYYVEIYPIDFARNRISTVPAKLTFTTGFDARTIVDNPVVSIDNISSDTIELSWTSVENAAEYYVCRSENDSVYDCFIKVAGTSYIDIEGIDSINSYSYKIVAINGNDSESVSTSTAAVTIPLADSEKVIKDAELLTFESIKLSNTSLNNIQSQLNLFRSGANGSNIDWASSDGGILNPTSGTVNIPNNDTQVILIATLKFAAAIEVKVFNLLVKSIVDTDNDGVPDDIDAFPNNALESVDTDSDGIGNNADQDDDNDGLPDTYELVRGLDPFNAFDASYDLDGDLYSNIIEFSFRSELNDAGSIPLISLIGEDSDSDGIPDVADAFPLDAAEFIDSDGDGIGNNADADDDDDGTDDSLDGMPLDENETADSDGDGVGDIADAFPDDATEALDTDGDGIGNNSDFDDDDDGVFDSSDIFPLDPTESIDTDSDGVGDNGDTFPLDSTEWVDTDGDGLGDNADIDADGDGVDDNQDAFPIDASEWLDSDSDGFGDNTDAFPFDENENIDTDLDGVGNNADADDDGDGVLDVDDAYPLDSTLSASENTGTTSSGGGGSLGGVFLSIVVSLTIFRRRKFVRYSTY